MHLTPAAAPSTDASGADRLRGRLMAHALGRLLDRVPGAREVLPHLAALERGLLEQGAQALSGVPGHWLGRICSQLSSLPFPDDDTALHELLDRLTAAQEAQRAERDNLPFDIERTVVIEEISHSDFMAVARGEAPTQRDDIRLQREGG